MTLENYSRRDRMWFHPTLRLRRDTSPEQVRRMMDGILKVLSKHPMVTVGGTPLRFTKIGDQSFDIEVFAYVETPDYDRYLKVQTELLLSLLEKSVELGVGFAMPVVETLNVTVPDEMKAGDGFRLGPTPKEMRPLEG